MSQDFQCEGCKRLDAAIARATKAEADLAKISVEWEKLATEHMDAEFDRIKRHEAESDSRALRAVLGEVLDQGVVKANLDRDLSYRAYTALAAGPVDDPAPKEAVDVLREILRDEVFPGQASGMPSTLRARASAIVQRHAGKVGENGGKP